jgi:hypothetical protein
MIYNLSANSGDIIEQDKMSIVGYELDMLQQRNGVQFVVSAGNHDLWKNEKSLEDILDDDDSQITPPADSLYSITVALLWVKLMITACLKQTILPRIAVKDLDLRV